MVLLIAAGVFLCLLAIERATCHLGIAALRACIWCVAYAVLASEILSLAGYFNAQGLSVAWAVLLACVLVKRVRSLRSASSTNHAPAAHFSVKTFDALLLVGGACSLLLIFALLAVTALSSPPNSWDAMTYHLPRALHWLQQNSLTHYPTWDVRQLFLNPLPSILQSHVFASDLGYSYANVVQCMAFLFTCLAAAELSRALGAPPIVRMAAALSIATLPIGILEATGTLSDCVHALFQICTMLFLLRILKSQQGEKQEIADWCALGAAWGLSIAAKGTAVLFSIPLLLVMLIAFWRQFDRTLLLRIAIIPIMILLLNGPFWMRNHSLFGHPLGPTQGALTINSLKNEPVGLEALFTNLQRNVSLQLITTSAEKNAWVKDTIVLLHEKVGIPLNAPGYTWPGTAFPLSVALWDENIASNVLHFLLLIISLLLAPFLSRRIEVHALWTTVFIGLVDVLLFCAFLKWQPWHTRLHLVLFVQLLPLVPVVAYALLGRLGILALCVGFVWNAAGPLLHNTHRPLLGESSIVRASPETNLFRAKPGHLVSYSNVAHTLARSSCQEVGLIFAQDDWEFPLWYLTNYQLKQQKRFSSVRCSEQEFPHPPIKQKVKPCLLVWFNPPQTSPIQCRGRRYEERYRDTAMAVFERISRAEARNSVR